MIAFSSADLRAYTGNFGSIIGEGTSAVIYFGVIPEVNPYNFPTQNIAVKRIDPSTDAVDTLKWEVEKSLLENMNHPNIIKLIGYGLDEARGFRFLVFEHMIRGDLRSKIEYLNWKQVLQIAIDIAMALDHIHKRSQPITHRDIKSDNILLTEDYHAKLCDFGLAKQQGLQHAQVILMSAHQSPLGDKVPESDIHNYGWILYEMLSKIPLYHGIKGRPLRMHPTLAKEGCSGKTAKKMIQLQQRCVHHLRDQRPKTSEVIAILEKIQAKCESNPQRINKFFDGIKAVLRLRS